MTAASPPLVSVAVITYNQHHLLDECLASILAQDYPAIEIVVADDGSSDGTPDLLRDYAARHPGKFVLRLAEVNRGVTPNHDLALAACSGKYISWIGGDDVMLPGKIAAQVAYLESHPDCNICYHDVEIFDGGTGRTIRLCSTADRPRNGGFLTLVRFGHFNTGISSMVRRSASPTHFESSIPVASDWIYFVECLADGGRIDFIPGIYGRQRRHAGNVTRSPDRCQPAHLFAQHLQSCAIILARWPRAAAAVRFRTAALLRMQRWQDDSAHYDQFLRASFATRWSFKVAVALIISRWCGIRR